MTTEIIEADIVKWLAGNQWLFDNGYLPKYHAAFCDPPYFLGSIVKRFGAKNSAPAKFGKDGAFSRASKGFMGKTWDGFEDVWVYQEWVTQWATLLLSAVYPGAIGLFFGGTRTYHRLAAGLEDAGWEVIDSIAYMYGCLDEETEILTKDGWVQYHTDISKSLVLCYNKDTDEFIWGKPTNVFKYQYNDTAYRVQSDHTDQLISRNHRCLVEREGTLLFEFAENAAQEHEIRVPILEGVRGVQRAIRNAERNTSDTESVLRTLFASEKNKQTSSHSKTVIRAKTNIANLPRMWQGVLHPHLLCKQRQRTSVQQGMQWQSTRQGMGSAGIQRRTFAYSRIVQGSSALRGKQPFLEGRNYISQSQGALFQSEYQVREMPTGIYRNVPKRWICDGTQTVGSTGHRACIAQAGSSASCKSQRRGQSVGKFRIIRNQRGSQDVRKARIPTTDLATITPTHYSGIMWCPTVPTGAFVARRNGKVFITGNSGFPKSHSVSDTHGTALKPAYEPCLVARAPRGKYTFADLQINFNTGLYNIDGARVGNEVRTYKGAGLSPQKIDNHQSGDTGIGMLDGSGRDLIFEANGRWPSNLLLSHSEDCTDTTCTKDCPVRELGEQSGDLKGGGSVSGNEPSQPAGGAVYGRWERVGWEAHNDSGSAARFFYTAKTSTWEREVGLDDIAAKPFGASNQAQAEIKRGNTESLDDATFGIGQIKQLRNNHPTLKPISITEYLSRLLLPPANGTPRRILIPFAGSGSECIGAQLAGWDEITGVEREHEYTTIATARLKWWSQFKTYEDARKTKEVKEPEPIIYEGMTIKQMEMPI